MTILLLNTFFILTHVALYVKAIIDHHGDCYGDPHNFCLTLYNDSESRKWSEAYDYCIIQGANLVIIPDNKTQTRVNEFLQQAPQKPDKVWINGKQSVNADPVDFNGQAFTKEIHKNPFEETPNQNCVYMQIEPRTFNRQLYWDDCDENQAMLRAVCQRPQSGGESCPGIQEAGQCYYLKSPEVNIDWFTARRRCQETPGGDLIYTQLDNTAVLEHLREAMNPNKSDGSPTCWTGIHRKPWQWITGESMITELMNYFNFEPNHEHLQESSCLVLVKESDSFAWYWNTMTCNEKTNHFICSRPLNVPTVHPSNEAMSSPGTLVTGADITNTAAEAPTSPAEQAAIEPSGFNLLYLIPVIVAVVAVVVVVTVLVLRKRRQPKPPKQTLPIYENDEAARANHDRVNPTSQPHTDSSPDHYSEINLDITEDDDGYASVPGDGPLPGSISPYGEYHTEQKPKLKNRVSALFMGLKPKLPTRKGFAKEGNLEIKGPKSAKSGRKETMDSIPPPTSPKPKPKPKPKIPRANKAPKKPVRHFVTEEGDEYALSDKTNIDEPTMFIEGTSEAKTTAMQYKVTPQGDEYALVIKDDVNTSNDDITTGNDDAIGHMTTESGDVYALPTKDKIKPSAGLRDL